MGSRFICDNCKKQYVTDNTWLTCDRDDEMTVLATFCCKSCMEEYVKKEETTQRKE